jgi:predicted Zn-dependent peptidase
LSVEQQRGWRIKIVWGLFVDWLWTMALTAWQSGRRLLALVSSGKAERNLVESYYARRDSLKSKIDDWSRARGRPTAEDATAAALLEFVREAKRRSEEAEEGSQPLGKE